MHKYNDLIILRIFRVFLAIIFVFSSFGTNLAASAMPMLLPQPGTMISLTTPFSVPSLIGIQVFPEDPLKFSFLLGQGDQKFDIDELRPIAEKSIRYFLTGLTIPDQDLWVNLSPYESDRIISPVLAQTEMGQDMLAQDYVLKQLSASLTYPESELGKKFWDKVYQKVRERFGDAEIPVDLFNKVWVVPEKAVVYETADQAVVKEARLKVMLETDYLAQKENGIVVGEDPRGAVSNEVMREVVIPLLEEEMNHGRHFAVLRQVYHALILSSWFKDKLRQSAVAQVYADKEKIGGVTAEDAAAIQDIYQEYLEAYKLGAYDYIKEDVKPSGEMIPRRYFSGGEIFGDIASHTQKIVVSKKEMDRAMLGQKALQADIQLAPQGGATPVSPVQPKRSGSDEAMITVEDVAVENSNPGTFKLIRVRRQTYDDKQIRLFMRLVALDFLIDNLETLAQESEQNRGWYRWAAGPTELSKAAQVIRTLIEKIKKDFNQIHKLDPQHEEHLLKEHLRTLIKEAEDENGAANIVLDKESNVTVRELLEKILNNPNEIPEIPGMPQEEFENKKVKAYKKFDAIYQEQKAAVLKRINKSADENPDNDDFQLFKMIYPATIEHMRQSLDRGDDAVKGYSAVGYAAALIARAVKELSKNQAEYDDLKKRYEALKDDGGKKEELKVIESDMANKEKQVSMYSELKSVFDDVFLEALLDPHRHASELRMIISIEVESQINRLQDDINNQIENAQKERGARRSVDKSDEKFQEPEAINRLFQLKWQYLSIVKAKIETLKTQFKNKGAKNTTYSYHRILHDAVDEVLDGFSLSAEEREEYRVLLNRFTDHFDFVAKFEYPPFEKDGIPIVVMLDYLPTAAQYANIAQHFDSVLANVITTQGSTNSHWVLYAATDGVGAAKVEPEKVMALNGHNRVQISRTQGGKAKLVFFTQGETVEEESEEVVTKEMINAVYGKKRRTLGANADALPGVLNAFNKYKAKSIGLLRSENALGVMDVPTKNFWKNHFRSILDASSRMVTIRAFDWRLDKRPGIFHHINYNGTKFYLDENFQGGVGLQVFQEQIRALIELRDEGYENIKFMFPMVETTENLEVIEKTITDIVQYEYPKLHEKLKRSKDAAIEKENQFGIAQYDRSLLEFFGFDLGIMVETEAAVDRENLKKLVKTGWVRFISIGSNDLISIIFKIDRGNSDAEKYYVNILPEIIYHILNVERAAVSQDKFVSICGELADKKRFWALHRILQDSGFDLGLSVPAPSIPVYNGLVDAMNDLMDNELAEDVKQLKTMIDEIRAYDSGNAADQLDGLHDKYYEPLNDLLDNITTRSYKHMEQKVADTLMVPLDQDGKQNFVKKVEEKSQSADNAMIADEDQSDDLGGVDFTEYQDIVEVEGGGFQVPFDEDSVITIGGPNFSGFTFEILSMTPYAAGI